MTVQGEGNLWGGGWGPGMPFYRGSVTEAPPTIESNNFVRIKGCCNEFLYFKLQRRNAPRSGNMSFSHHPFRRMKFNPVVAGFFTSQSWSVGVSKFPQEERPFNIEII